MENNFAIKVISLALTSLTIATGWLFNSLGRTNIDVDRVQEAVYETREDISAIKTDVGWIREALDDLKDLTSKNGK